MAQVTILATIAAAFNHLKDDVHTALLTQLGDAAQLQQRIQACSRLMLQISQVGYSTQIWTNSDTHPSTKTLFQLISLSLFKKASF